MTRQQKESTMAAIKLAVEGAHLYLLNCEGLKANQLNALRGRLHEADIRCRLVPNSLLKILFTSTAHEPLLPVLKEASLLLSTKGNPSIPAKIIKKFQDEEGIDKPYLKGAWAYEGAFLGKENLQVLAALKTKEELLAEVISLLQAPAARVIAALQSTTGKLPNLLKTLADK